MNTALALTLLSTAPCAAVAWSVVRAMREADASNLGRTLAITSGRRERRHSQTVKLAWIALAWFVLMTASLLYAADRERLVVRKRMLCDVRPYGCRTPPWYCGTDGEGGADPVDRVHRGSSVQNWSSLPVMTRLRYVFTPSTQDEDCARWQRTLQRSAWPNVIEILIMPLLRGLARPVVFIARTGGRALVAVIGHFGLMSLLQLAIALPFMQLALRLTSVSPARVFVTAPTDFEPGVPPTTKCMLALEEGLRLRTPTRLLQPACESKEEADAEIALEPIATCRSLVFEPLVAAH